MEQTDEITLQEKGRKTMARIVKTIPHPAIAHLDKAIAHLNTVEFLLDACETEQARRREQLQGGRI